MSPATDRIKAVFLGALEKDRLADRAAFLAEACADDPALRQSVEALLQAHDRTDRLLDRTAREHLADELGDAAKPDDPLDFLEPSQKPGSLGRLDHYEVLEVAGRGGMGVVFRAFDEKLHRVVAIKALAPHLAAGSTGRQRFAREARAAAAVTHENVIPIYAVEESGPIPYLVMQFIEGQSLQEKLERSGPLSLKETLRIGLHIAEGLAAAHRQGLVHRDIKPANILLENGVERVKLTDFGLARTIDHAGLTQTGVMAGTPTYMSPEQIQGRTVDFRSDLFSLGSVLYAMCTGRPPFNAPSTYAVLKRVCEETPRPVQEINPELPPWLDELLARLHAKAPADRYATAQEVADLLTERLAELQRGASQETQVIPRPSEKEQNQAPPKEPPSPPEDRMGFPFRRSWLMVAAVLLPLLGVLGVGEATGVTNVRSLVIRLFDAEGTLVIEVDDPGVSISVDGEELVITGAGAREIRLKPGRYQVQATKDGKLIRQELVTISRNGREVVRVSREPAPMPAAAADDEEWRRTVAGLPAAEQVRAVAARLKELNPGFDGKVTPTITGDLVTGVSFSTDQVTNISPVGALVQLAVLDCSGTGPPAKGKLADLSPVRGLRLRELRCAATQISDLSPLQGMPLAILYCGQTPVSDLSPLKGMSLIEFDCSFTQVADLSPLRGMRLERLGLEVMPLSDLSPLEGMPLTMLSLYATQVANLAPLKGMALTSLNIQSTQVSDLTPLKGMTTLRRLNLPFTPVNDLSALQGLPLEYLAVSETLASDLSPLKGMPLEALLLDYNPQRGDAEILRSMKNLKEINRKPAGEFWKEHER